MLRYLLSLVFMLLVQVCASRAEVAALHEGAKDPVAEGWRKFRPFLSVDTHGVTNDLAAGIDAWSIGDRVGAGTSGHDGVYGVLLSPTQLSHAERRGWRLSVNMRIVQCALGETHDAITSAVIDSTHTYAMQFGKTQAGAPMVQLLTGDNRGPIIEVADLTNGYHLYELAFNPASRSVQLFVDGKMRANNYGGIVGADLDLDNSRGALGNVYFGSTSNNLMAQANYSIVKYEIYHDNKIVIPTPPEFEAKSKLIKEVYQKDFEAARTAEQKRTLAKRLLGDGGNTTDDDSGRYVLLYLAQQLAAENADLDTMLSALDQITQLYAIDVLDIKAQSLDILISAARKGRRDDSLILALKTSIDEAVDTDQYELARKLADLTLKAARDMRNIGLIKGAVDQLKEIEELEKEFIGIRAALLTLKSKPADPKANLTVGSYECFVKGKWDNGLTMLALGNDATLKALAERELSGPTTPGELVSLGDDWWEQSRAKVGRQHRNLTMRGQYWYEKALPNVSGLTRTRLEKRLEERAQPKPRFNLPAGTVVAFDFERSAERVSDGKHYLLDRGENKSNGEIVNCAFVSGVHGAALRFRGKGFVKFSDASLPDGNNPRSILCWLRIDEPLPWQSVFVYGAHEAGNATYMIVLGQDDSKGRSLKLGVGNPGGMGEPAGQTIVADGEWHHVAMVFNGRGTAELFVDGKLDLTFSRTYNTSRTGQAMLGGWVDGNPVLAGTIDDFIVVNRSLAPDEIIRIKDSGFANDAITKPAGNRDLPGKPTTRPNSPNPRGSGR